MHVCVSLTGHITEKKITIAASRIESWIQLKKKKKPKEEMPEASEKH